MQDRFGRGQPSVAARATCLAAMLFLATFLRGEAIADMVPPGSQDILGVLDASATAWSKGDLGGFMRCYENAPETAYLNNNGLVRGYASIQAMYAARYADKPGSMGMLSLKVLDLRRLGADYALVAGRYTLTRPAQNASGVFTLVFHRSASGWRIISDHSS